jgi:hypothetical protein
MITPTPLGSPRRRWPTLIFGILALAVIAACSSTTKAASPAASSTAAATPTARPTPSPTNTLSGPVGTVYKVTDDSGNVMTVKLTQVIDPAQGADQYTTPNNGFRFVSAVFTLNGVSGTFSDDANSDATLIGSNSQTYTFDASNLAGVTNFNNGEYNLTPGQTSVGAVAFQVPDRVKVSSIQWGGTFGSSAATWTVSAVSSSGTSAGAWATVYAYYQDITSKDYAAAWRLLGYNPQGGGYASFVAGYADTGTQAVTEISASGDQVSFTLTSDNPNGTVQTYAGTDTVTGGRIIHVSVTQTG